MKGDKPVIGLAGGVGSGKSLVAKMFVELGAGLIDFDQLNAIILTREDVKAQLQSWWGDEILDTKGDVDRKKVAQVIFDDQQARKRLEALSHPLIDDLRKEKTARFEHDARIQAVVLDAPLLFEASLDRLCDATIYIDADERLRSKRTRQTRGWDDAEMHRREKTQIPLDRKRAQSDYIVVNNSDINTLRRKVEEVYRQLRNSIAHHGP